MAAAVNHSSVAAMVRERLLARNPVCAKFFEREAPRLAEACKAMSERFLDGGRLLAFGRGPHFTDAQHVSVEFVHPVIVGKRALPALDISMLFRPWLDAILHPADIVMGFSPPEGDPAIDAALRDADRRGAMTLALSGPAGAYHCEPASTDAFIHQEVIEILYHTLWETVHVFLERRELGLDAGQAGFLYPFLGRQEQPVGDVVAEVAASILLKVRDDDELRSRLAAEEAGRIAEAVLAMRRRIDRGGKLILFGNGGSATDANDFAIDCVLPPVGYKPIPAVSISLEPANITAIANDVGTEVIFLRQLIAQSRPDDIAVAFSTSGGSRNIIQALEEARKRGLLTVALLGYDGGEIVRSSLADYALVARSDYIPRIQEAQASVYHTMREMLEAARPDRTNA
jgi:D-sedoheptulose 7-phosphate isomerase